MGDVLRVNVIGVSMSAIDLPGAVEAIAEAITTNRREYVCTCPVYTIMRAREDESVRAAIEGAGLATPDGMPVVWALRQLGHRQAGRVYGPDILLAACERGLSEGWRHYFLGGGEGVAEAMVERLRARFPGLIVAGLAGPPFRPLTQAEDDDIVRTINASGAQIVWVGLGSPKQDIWMAEHRARLEAPALVGVGAAFDMFAGRVRQAPRWMQRAGLEWLFRFAQEPRRLARRYLIYNPLFVWCFIRQWIGLPVSLTADNRILAGENDRRK